MRKKFILLLILSVSLFLPATPYGSGQEVKFQEPEQAISLIVKIEEAKKLLEPVDLAHSDKVTTLRTRYKMVVIKRGRRKKRKTIKSSYKDFEWKESALAVLYPSGKIAIVKIRREKQNLMSMTGGFLINLEDRPSGIKWNGKNTAFVVKNSRWETLIVIGIKWLETDSEVVLERKGKKQKRVTRYFTTPTLYVPYSTGLHQRELIKQGNDHYDSRSQTAYDDLDRKGVKSLVLPTKNVTEVIRQNLSIKNLCLIEHTDPTEYDAFVNGEWKYDPYERVLVRLGVNGDSEFSNTKSHAGARGLKQFMYGTWIIVSNAYPLAELPDYLTGTSNHVTSIQAAVLLYDYNLNELKKEFGLSILEDPQLEYYLAAGYNGGIGRVIAGIRKYGHDWTRNLLNETKIYVEELEYLHQHPVNPAP